MPASSSSAPKAEALAPGTIVAGFRIERVLGRGSRGVVYEATQPGLDRRIALKLVAANGKPAAHPVWPEHPHVIDLYAAGTCEQGRFFAMQLVRGQTLRERLAAGGIAPARVRDVLADVEDALQAAHAEGLVHGAVTADSVLVGDDGRTGLSDFATVTPEATPAFDRASLAALRREYAEPRIAISRLRWALVPLAAAGVVAALLLTRSGAAVAPPPARGAQPLGSALPSAGERSVDCTGRPASGASPACTLVQTRLPARRVAAVGDGVIRAWTVRGARGDLSLRVIRRRAGRFETVQATPYRHVADVGVHALPADLTIRTGEHVGVELAPGSAIGVRNRHGAAALQFTGPLDFVPRRPDRAPAAIGADLELLLRMDYIPGAHRRLPDLLTGAAAARAPAGRRLDQRDVELAQGRIATLAVVRAGGHVALDLLSGRRRVARLAVPDADPRGTLLDLRVASSRGFAPRPELRWRNPGGAAVAHTYRIGAVPLEPLD
jgi:hypothetical protein